MTRHIHADLIHAWAEGADIEVLDQNIGWIDSNCPEWVPQHQYRIKQRTVKREGWTNIYPIDIDQKIMAKAGYVYDSYDAAIANCRNMTKIATVKIKWEEEQ